MVLCLWAIRGERSLQLSATRAWCDLSLLESSLKNTETKQGCAPETGKEQKEERVALIPEHLGTRSAA